MTGERRQHEQHPFSPCHTLFRIHDDTDPQSITDSECQNVLKFQKSNSR